MAIVVLILASAYFFGQASVESDLATSAAEAAQEQEALLTQCEEQLEVMRQLALERAAEAQKATNEAIMLRQQLEECQGN